MAILKKDSKKEDKKKTTKAAKQTKKEQKKFSPSIHSNAHRVLMKAIITEKVANLESEGKYVFEVAKNATKSDVKRAVQSVYGVTPKKVHVINVLGNNKRSGFKHRKLSSSKKAIVTLKKGETIQIYEGV